MNPLEIVGGILLLLAGVFIIFFVMMQESKQPDGMGAITGNSSSDNYISRNTGVRTKEAFLARVTKILAGCIFVLAFILNLLVRYL